MTREEKELAKATSETGGVNRAVATAVSGGGAIARLLRKAQSNPVLDERRKQLFEDLKTVRGRRQQTIRIDGDLVLEYEKKKYFLTSMKKLLRAEQKSIDNGKDGDTAYTLGLYQGFGGLILEVGSKKRIEVPSDTFFDWVHKKPVSV